jgi:hypothetical protein
MRISTSNLGRPVAGILLAAAAVFATVTTTADAASTAIPYCWVNKDNAPYWDYPPQRGGRLVGYVESAGRYFQLTHLDGTFPVRGGRLDGRGDVVWFNGVDIGCNPQ